MIDGEVIANPEWCIGHYRTSLSDPSELFCSNKQFPDLRWWHDNVSNNKKTLAFSSALQHKSTKWCQRESDTFDLEWTQVKLCWLKCARDRPTSQTPGISQNQHSPSSSRLSLGRSEGCVHVICLGYGWISNSPDLSHSLLLFIEKHLISLLIVRSENVNPMGSQPLMPGEKHTGDLERFWAWKMNYDSTCAGQTHGKSDTLSYSRSQKNT